MNPQIMELLLRLPEAGLLLAAIYMFLSHIASEARQNREHTAKQNEMLVAFYKEMHRDHMDHSETMTRSIQQLIAITEKNISATARNTFVLETISESVKAHLIIPKENPA